MKLLLVTTSLPHGRRHGAETATMNLLAGMRAAGHAVDVAGYVRPGDTTALPEHFYAACDWPVEVETAGTKAYQWMLKALATGKPFITTKFQSAAMTRLLRSLSDRNRYDAIIINHAHMGWVLDEPMLPKRKIFVAHNVEAPLYAAMGAQGSAGGLLKRAVYKREGQLVAQLEHRLASACDQVWTLTDADARAFASRGAAGKTRVLGLPGQAFAPLETPVTPTTDIGILGNWAWDINRRGLAWFMGEIVPRLPPDLTIAIAGNRADLVPNPYRNVRYLGFVDDAGAFLRDCRVLAVPTLVGGGVQIKTIEGISAGMPMVATSLGLRGIDDAPRFVHQADTAPAIAAKLAELAGRRDPIDTRAGRLWAENRRQRFNGDLQMALDALLPSAPQLEPAA